METWDYVSSSEAATRKGVRAEVESPQIPAYTQRWGQSGWRPAHKELSQPVSKPRGKSSHESTKFPVNDVQPRSLQPRMLQFHNQAINRLWGWLFFPCTKALCLNSVLWELFIEGICPALDLFSSLEPRKLFNVDDSEHLHVHVVVMDGAAAVAVWHTALIYFTPLLQWVTDGRKTGWQKSRKAKDWFE